MAHRAVEREWEKQTNAINKINERRSDGRDKRAVDSSAISKMAAAHIQR